MIQFLNQLDFFEGLQAALFETEQRRFFSN